MNYRANTLVILLLIIGWACTNSSVAVHHSATESSEPMLLGGWGISGDSIQGRSEKSRTSVYKNLSRELNVDAANSNHLSSNKMIAKFEEMLGGQRVLFKLTLKPNGHIAALETLKSSGSDELDTRLKELIRHASPFAPNPYPKNFPWLLELPKVMLEPCWAPVTIKR